MDGLHPILIACNCYTAALSELQGDFEKCFKDVCACEKELNLVFTSFDVDSVEVANNLQMELIEIQYSDSHCTKFALVSPIES